MTIRDTAPVRIPAVTRGDIPGLLRRGMPTVDPHGNNGVYEWCQDNPPGSYWTIDWSDPASIYLALHYLADRGRPSLWMLPTTHGGRAEAWDGLTAWEVSAIVVAQSVVRVSRGMGPVSDLLFDYDDYDDHEVRYSKRDGRLIVRVNHETFGGQHEGWMAHRTTGPETGDAGKLAADTAALLDGCALLVPGGVTVPP